MKTHVLVTYSDEMYYISEEQARKAMQLRDSGQSIEFKDYPGEFIMPGNVKSIGLSKKSQGANQGSDLKLTAEELFALPSGHRSTGFWFTIVQINQQRNKDGKPWIFQKLLDHAMSQTNISEPHGLVEFIDAEWDTIEADTYNIQAIREDKKAKRIIKEWLSGDIGRAYLLSKGERLIFP